jgi:NHLM bacteriocin system ABC transporter peptidase/ATP-binding protein
MSRQHVVKPPVIMQMEALECGAASLAMVLAYHKKWLPLERVREDCGVSRDGSSAINIVKAAQNYGLLYAANQYSPEQVEERASFPCIIHWNYNHFVVLNGFKGEGEKRRAVINDPAEGLVYIPMPEFSRAFTGICLTFEPGEDFKPEGKPRSMIRFVSGRLQGSYSLLLLVMAVSFLVALADILAPVFSRVLADNILTGANTEWIIPFIAGFCVLILFSLVVNFLLGLYSMKIKGKLAIVSSVKFMWHTLRLPMRFFSQRLAGDLANRQDSNDQIANTLVVQLAPALINLLLLLLYLVVMVRYSIPLTAVGIAAVILNIVISQIIAKKRVDISRAQMRDQGKLIATTVSGIDMIETIKASGAEDGFFEKWAGIHALVKRSEEKMAKVEGFIGVLPEFIVQLSNTVVLVLGAILIMRGQFSAGMLLAFQGFLHSFFAPVSSLLTIGERVQEMRVEMERVEDVMKYKPDVADDEETLAEDVGYEKIVGDIEMKHVTFGYSPLAPPLIEDFNMTLKQGCKVAFVGSSGCGKSTLSMLLSGLYEPWSGEILFDGKRRDEIPRSVFAASLAVVDQEVILFEDSILENIKMWDDTIEDFEVIMAARDAGVHEDIVLREGGYDHQVSEGGRNFSGGQRQRFEIARVLAQDPTVIILDEATSALDAKTEYDVIHAIKNRGVSCVIIAHRLSTIRDCDEIIVLDKGKIKERGTHDELFAAGGLYTQLISVE